MFRSFSLQAKRYRTFAMLEYKQRGLLWHAGLGAAGGVYGFAKAIGNAQRQGDLDEVPFAALQYGLLAAALPISLIVAPFYVIVGRKRKEIEKKVRQEIRQDEQEQTFRRLKLDVNRLKEDVREIKDTRAKQ